jgi:uncharacterized membrane protein
MAFCPNCGAQVDGRFCAKCGAAVEPGATASTAMPPPPPANAGLSSGLTQNVVAALCYALGLITGILFLVLAPYNQDKEIRFHAFQSIFLHVAVIILFAGIMPILAIASGGFMFFLSPLLGLGTLFLWLFMIWKAYQGQKVVLPVIGPLAEKQA